MNKEEHLQKVIELGQELQGVKDVDILLSKILKVSREFTDADAGSIYIKEGDQLHFQNSQNDTLQSLLPEGKKLIFSTFTMPLNKKSIAGYAACTCGCLNIEDVYKIEKDKPYTFNKSYDELVNYRTKSMLTVPLKKNTGEAIGVLQLINATDKEGTITPFSKDIEPLITLLANDAAMAIERAQLTRQIILRMIKMAELRDPKETGAHVSRVASYSVEIYEAWARKKNIDEKEIEKDLDVLKLSSMLHDAGKIAISDSILKKPGRLDDEERLIMNGHTYLGAKLFNDAYSETDKASFVIALEHHERWDGMGYPGYIDVNTGEPLEGKKDENGKAIGKKEEEIHPFARVVAIADVYDALSSARTYKKAWAEEDVLNILREEAGKQFDPLMIECFFENLDIIKNIRQKYPNESV